MNRATVHQFPTPPTRRAPRVNSWRWNEDEDEAIDVLPQECQIIYLRVFRKHMDYATGIVGIKRAISYGQIKERLEYQPPFHSNEQRREYSQGQIKRLIQKLVDAGLAERMHDTSKGITKMIFRLPMACSGIEEPRHDRDTVTATRREPGESRPKDGDRDMSATREARHPSGSPLTPNPLTTFEGSPKKSKPKKWGEEIDHELAELMFARVTADLTNPKRPNMNSWANEIRLMRTSDKRTEKQIRYLINWVVDDEFWSTVVMCPTKLRKKWDQLEKKVVAYKESRHANRSGTDAKRAEQDRIAARLANPNDDGWMDGLFEEDAVTGAGEPSIYPAGSDIPKDVANGVQHGSDADVGQTGGGYLDGEVVNPADDASRGCSGRADQGGRWGMAPERGQSGEVFEAEAGGFWNA